MFKKQAVKKTNAPKTKAVKTKKELAAQESFIGGAQDEPRQGNRGGRPVVRKPTKRISLYLGIDIHEDLALLARVENKSVSVLVNDACGALVATHAKVIAQLKKAQT